MEDIPDMVIGDTSVVVVIQMDALVSKKFQSAWIRVLIEAVKTWIGIRVFHAHAIANLENVIA